MSVVFSEGVNLPEQGSARHKLRNCALCAASFVSRHEHTEICDSCRTRELEKADQCLDELAPNGINTSEGKRRVRLCLNDVVPSESSQSELPAKTLPPNTSPAKTQWKSPPFKAIFEETAKEAAADLFVAKPQQMPPGRLRTKLGWTMLLLLVGASLWIYRYGVPEIVRQLAQRAVAAFPQEQDFTPQFPKSAQRPTTY